MTSTAGDAVAPGDARHAAQVRRWPTELSLLLMALIWGVNFSIVKFGTTLVDPLAFNALRVLLAATLLTAIVLLGDMALPSRRTVAALLALGVLGNGVYQFFFVEGIALTRASDAALVVAASPAFIAIIGRVRGVDRVNSRGALGIALSIAGIGLVVFGTSQGDQGVSSLYGDLLVLCGSLAWAIYTVLLKPFTERVAGPQLSALTMIGGAIPLFIVASPAIGRAQWRALPTLGWMAMFYSGVFALVVAYFFWYNGVRVIGPTRTAMYSNLQPVIAVVVAWIFLHEVPTVWQGFGAACIMGGLLLTRP
jgi:drug/metabolite transporter (DMT)-like permease